MTRVLKHKQSVKFNAEDPSHLEIYARFLLKGHWDCHIKFMLEEPHMIVPSMIERKLAVQYLRDRGAINVTDKIKM